LKASLKISVFWWVFHFVVSAYGQTAASLVLGRGIELSSRQGDISDPKLVSDLSSLMKDTAQSSSTRTEAAYLLTYASTGGSEELRTEAVNTALSSVGVDNFLSDDAVTRLYRIRGDLFYDRGKFNEALQNYGEVQKRAKAGEGLSDYALLRIGWCYINQERAGQAFAIWLPEVGARLKNKKVISSSLLHGLGQSFTEDLKRSPDQAAALAGLSLDSEQRDSLAKGLVDGINYLKDSGQISSWWRLLEKLSWRSEVAAHLDELSNAAGRRACDLLPMVQKSTDVKTTAGNLRLVENCTLAYLKRAPGTQVSKNLLHTLLAAADLRADQRKIRYDFYRFEKDNFAACQEGIAWLTDEEDGRTAFSVPLNETTSVCLDTLKQPNGKLPTVAKSIAAMVDGHPSAFKTTSDPALYLANALLKNKSFAIEFSSELLAHPEKYRGLLVTQLTAESLLASQQEEKAESMRNIFGRAETGSVTQNDVWKNLAIRKFRKLVDDGKLDEARVFLNQDCPLASSPGEKDCTERWSYLVFKEASDPVRVEQTKTTVATVLDAGKVNDAQITPWIDLGVKLNLWPNVWNAIKNRTTALSGFAKVALFESLVSEKFRPEKNEIPSLKNVDVREIVSFAGSLNSKNKSDLQKLTLSKNSPLAPDLKVIQNVETRSHGALKSRREPVEELSAWVDFLNANSKNLTRRKWVSLVMYSRGIESVETFCRQATERLPRIPASHQVSGEEWTNLVQLLAKRLEDCRNWVQQSRNELAPKTEKTSGGNT
jgi:hypothetical protein